VIFNVPAFTTQFLLGIGQLRHRLLWVTSIIHVFPESSYTVQRDWLSLSGVQYDILKSLAQKSDFDLKSEAITYSPDNFFQQVVQKKNTVALKTRWYIPSDIDANELNQRLTTYTNRKFPN